jgi:hypothetical protein
MRNAATTHETQSPKEGTMQESYSAAMSWMKKAQNHGKACQWSGGEGWVCEGYYCPRRKRVISRTWNPTTGATC